MSVCTVISAKLLFLIFTEAVLDVHLISALPAAGRFVMDICREVRRKWLLSILTMDWTICMVEWGKK
nr:hypothetical protein CFP56_47939 [Quercus suber]